MRIEFAVCCLVVTCAGNLRAQVGEDLPRRPFNPTRADCQRLETQYAALLKQAYDADFACMKQPLKFGTVQGCSGRRELTAWVQCEQEALRICGVDKAKTEQVKACYDEAKANEKPEEAAQADREDDIAKRLKQANDLIENGQTLANLIDHPAEFFKAKLDPTDALMKKLFSDPSDLATLRPDLAEEIYRFAEDYAKVGLLAASMNPAVLAIQLTMLDQIGRRYKQLKQQLNEIDLQLNATAFLKDSTLPSRVVPSQKHSEPAVPDCSIFQNEAASRDLMNRDSATWLRLYAACGKQK